MAPSFTARVKTISLGLLLLPVWLAIVVITHEFGHVLTIKLLDLGNATLYVFPGYELYPDLGKRYPVAWPDSSLAITNSETMISVPIVTANVASSAYSADQAFRSPGFFTKLPVSLSGNPSFSYQQEAAATEHKQSIAMLMGAGFTELLSLLALALLYFFRPGKWLAWVLSLVALMTFDIFTYTIFPVFFDAPHLLFVGGNVAEPLNALIALGMNRQLAIAGIIGLSLCQFAALYKYWRR